MKLHFYKLCLILSVVVFSNLNHAQGLVDPQVLPVYNATGTITVDGLLNEADWQSATPYMLFRANGVASGNASTPTGQFTVKEPYRDTSSCKVKFVRQGTKLYMSLDSDDKQVCRFDWEGDGMFMKFQKADGNDVEYKLYVGVKGGVPQFVLETNGDTTAVVGKGLGKAGTTIYDSSDVDAGYSGELMLDLAKLGYTSAATEVKLLINIFDPDNYSLNAPPWGPNGCYFKQWWGSEWGGVYRKLRFVDGVKDPASLVVNQAMGTITIDGLLNEPEWTASYPYLMFRAKGVAHGNANTPTGEFTVKEPYKDSSICNVKFLRQGTKLYMSLESDDKQVCRFDWEGDGMFMKIQKADASDVEVKLYVGVKGGVPQFVLETNGDTTAFVGKGLGKAGTTIYDSTDVDAGYAAELMIDLAKLGYASSVSEVKMLINIFDPDNYSLNAPPWGPNGNYYKQWWGSEWGGVYRSVKFQLPLPVELTSFEAKRIDNGVVLNWSTVTEVNNKGFEVQVSTDNASFKTVQFIAGNGTSNMRHNYSTLDNTEYNSGVYFRLKQVDLDGSVKYSQSVFVDMRTNLTFALDQNYPNPFNPSTSVSFTVPVKSNVTVEVFDAIGQRVNQLAGGAFEAGTHKLSFNGSSLNSGIYFVRINAAGENGLSFNSVRKMMLLK
ncbi:MAG: T9SS type A sorting domain-containing protein [Ignavibacteriales bacterium]|nr:T9SS type A sorting domain-containing protein [Ignavibacteriales bacterium]